MADFNRAQASINTRKFHAQVLEILERIAVALESQSPVKVTYQPIDPVGREEAVGEMKVLKEGKNLEPLQMIQATHCNCGTNYDRICTQCTPARIAEAYNRREE